MSEAYIYDAVRTPRGRGKPDGALHEVTSLALSSGTLRAIAERNHLPEDAVEDVILGCVDPVGEAGGDIARVSAMHAGLGMRHQPMQGFVELRWRLQHGIAQGKIVDVVSPILLLELNALFKHAADPGRGLHMLTHALCHGHRMPSS